MPYKKNPMSDARKREYPRLAARRARQRSPASVMQNGAPAVKHVHKPLRAFNK